MTSACPSCGELAMHSPLCDYVAPVTPHRSGRLLGLLLAALSGALVGSLLTLGVVRSASRPGAVVTGFAPVIVSGSPLPTAPRPAEVPTPGGASPPPAASGNRPEEATPRPTRGTVLLRLRATWYCNADPSRAPASRCTRGHPDGAGADLLAAISPDLAWLRGRRVTVCLGNGCVEGVRIVDCDCAARRSIDLYADVFAQLGALSVGVLSVEIRT